MVFRTKKLAKRKANQRLKCILNREEFRPYTCNTHYSSVVKAPSKLREHDDDR